MDLITDHPTGEPPSPGPPPPADEQPSSVRRAPLWWGVLTGMAAVAAALGVGQFVAGWSSSLEPPVISVGDRVVDGAPKWLKDFAISTFGTNDKPALIAGTVTLLAGLAVLAGVLTVRRRLAPALALVAVFAIVGMVAATTGRDATGNGWLPSFFAGLAAAATLLVVHRRLGRRERRAAPDPAPVAGAPSRRAFLGTIGALAAAALAFGATGRRLQRRFSNAAERAAVQVRAPAEPLRVTAADPATQIPGLSPLFVPNKDFYRIDTALIAPTVSTDGWQLAIDGMVDNPLRLTYEDLWKRTLVEYDVTLSCVSNEVGGDLVGNARWLGVRLDELLAEAKVRPDADQIMGHSVDGFTAGFPTDTLADGRNAIVALVMNGEVLPVAHGYPARLVVPGLYGYVSATKWLSRIELTRFDRAQGYWIPRGWSERAPIKTQSRIDTPRRGAKVDGTVAVAGVAWAPTRGITRVEVQVDDGPWQPANLGPEVSASSWRQWWWEWTTPPVGEHRLRCRATDGSGATQTEQRSRPDPDGATGWHTIDVEVR